MQNRASFDDHACFHISNWRWSIGSGRSECQQRRWRIATDVVYTSAWRPCENFAIILSGGIYSWNKRRFNECEYWKVKWNLLPLFVEKITLENTRYIRNNRELIVLSFSSFFLKIYSGDDWYDWLRWRYMTDMVTCDDGKQVIYIRSKYPLIKND